MTPVPMLLAEGVRKSYGDNEVLCGIDLEVTSGEVMCLLGPSGSGKSTFLRCINRLERVDGGRLYVDGERVGLHRHKGKLHEMTDRQLCHFRTQTAMVFQHFNLFPHMTVLGNVLVGPLKVKNCLLYTSPSPRD